MGAVLMPVLAGANLPGSTFEGNDGNLIVNTPGNLDWANAPSLAVGVETASGKGDNAFGQGTKEDDPAVSVVTGSIPPNKSDLTRFYIANNKAAGSSFLYLAWERSNVLGSANMDFEINKLAQPNLNTTGPKTLNRSPGDLLITFDFVNGGGTPVLGMLRWVTTGATSQCFATNALPCWGNRLNLSAAGVAEGQVNGGTVTDPIPNPDVSLPANTFGEAAINLSAAGVFPPGECVHFGSAFLKSRSSASFPAELKDFVAPTEINISNCGNIVIRKVTNPSPDPTDTSFNFTLAGGPSNLSAQFSLKNGESNATAGAGVLAGNGYNAAETVPANWQLLSATCDDGSPVTNIDVSVDETVTCTFTNRLQVGAIKVTKTRKHAAAGPGDHPHAGVNFTVNGVTKSTGADGTVCFDDLTFGDYTVHETVPAGYQGEADKTVTVDNVAFCADTPYVGESVAFSNTPLTNLSITVDSQVPGGTDSQFLCTPPGAPGGAFDTPASGDGTLSLNNLEPGVYDCRIVIDP